MKIPLAKFLFLEWLQRVHIPDPLPLVTSFAKITSLGVSEFGMELCTSVLDTLQKCVRHDTLEENSTEPQPLETNNKIYPSILHDGFYSPNPRLECFI